MNKAFTKIKKCLCIVGRPVIRFILKVKSLANYIFADRVCLHQKKNSDAKYLIYHYEGMSGLMTQLICVLGWLKYAKEKKYTLIVDMTSSRNIYSNGIGNAWEMFFLQPMYHCAVNSDEIVRVQKNENHAYCPSVLRHNLRYEWAYRDIAKLIKPRIVFPLPRDYKNRQELHGQFCKLYREYIHMNPQVAAYLDKEYSLLLEGRGKILGVLIRGTDYVQSKPYMHPIQPTVNQVIKMIDEISSQYHWDYIYLATEEKAISEQMKKCFPDKIIENQRQYYDGDYSKKWLYTIVKEATSDIQSDVMGLQYLSSINLLSKCHYLTGGLCGGTQAALIMNGGTYEFVKLYDAGDYGAKTKVVD